ncbi:MAG: hypothetical protein ACTSSK_11050, partial [Candidatus Heimdallarchaeota archaeon]
SKDIEHFGVANMNITQIRVEAYSTGTSEIVTLFDDLHFVTDVTGPTLINMIRDPVTVQYFDDATISIEASDNIELEGIELHYKVDFGSWNSVPMIFNGAEYESTIPAQSYGSFVEYYVEAIDIYGHETTFGTDYAPYFYTVQDYIDPELEIIGPLENEILSGSVQFDIDGYDLGSGLVYFEIRIDNIIITNQTTPLLLPTIFGWGTEYFENRDYNMTFLLEDGAGNINEQYFEYTIYNPPTQWEAFAAFMQQWGPYIGGGAGGLAIVVVVLVVVLRKKKGV